MKASLHSRKNVRLQWFSVEKISYREERKLEVTYSPYSVEQNSHTYTPEYQYVFSNFPKDLPQSEIIIFQNELPTTYAWTPGTKGNKFITDPQEDPDVSVTDRIIELTQGKEKITREPPEYPDPRIKEVEIREREDTVLRKISFKNESPQKIEQVEFKLVETKDVRFVKGNPPPSTEDKPEYTWRFPVEGEGTVQVELELKTQIRKTFNIERERDDKPNRHAFEEQLTENEEAY